MDLQWINGTDSVAEMATKTNVNFNALEEGVGEDILEAKTYADTVSATAKTQAIAETQAWAKGSFSRKNKLIDGDFQLWLDGTSFVAPSNAYTATMWKCNGTGTVTKVASGMQITGTVTIMQIMEALNFNKINGKTVTLSYSLNGVVYTSTYTASSATVVNLTIADKIINWIKLEEGDFRTPFESRHYGKELNLSQRYYEVSSVNVGTINESFAHAFSTTQADGRIEYMVEKRTNPTVSFVAETQLGNIQIFYQSAYRSISTIADNARGGTKACAFRIAKAETDTSTWSIGDTMQIRFHWIADARL